MENILGQIYNKQIKSETKNLEKFYESVKRRAKGIVVASGRQTLIIGCTIVFFEKHFHL